MNSKLLKILLAGVVAFAAVSCDDDSDKKDKDNKADKVCDAGAKKCDGSSLMVCGDNKWNVSETCNNGCNDEALACNPLVGSCTAGELQCDGNTLYVCDGTSWTTKQNCPNGCDAATKSCKAGSSEPDPGQSATKCDAEIEAKCDAMADLYGMEADEVACAVVDGKAGCVEVCSKEKEVDPYCYGSEFINFVCTKSDDGVLHWEEDEDTYKKCEFGCNSDGTDCGEALVSDEGQSCTSTSRADRCDGNVLSYCGASGKVIAGDCAEDDAVCATVDNGTYADCFYEEDVCTQVGTKSTYCDPYYEAVFNTECKAASDGKKYDVVDWDNYKECDYGCNAAGTDCADALVSDQGESCSSKTRLERCDGNIVSWCDDSYGEEYAEVDAFNCAEMNASCVVFAGANPDGSDLADCRKADEVCTLGQTKKVCEEEDYIFFTYAMVYDMKCAKASDGKNYWIADSSKEPLFCANLCSADKTDCDEQGYDDFDD